MAGSASVRFAKIQISLHINWRMSSLTCSGW